MTIDHIQKVVIEDFRCLPDQEVGPLGDFNLVVGRNGAGKTSFFEAIELALTGRSQRIGTREDIGQIVSRGGRTLLAVYGSGGQALGSFAEGKLAGGSPAQIRNMFGLEVEDQRARHLLPQLFGIHNVLYSDTIVSFLHANKKAELNNAVTELAAGVEAVKAWKKLKAASRHARSISQEAAAELRRCQQELLRLQAIVDELASRDDEHLVKSGQQLISRIPMDFWDDKRPPAVEQLPEFLEQVNRLMPRLSGTLDEIDELTETVALTGVKSWADISEVKAKAEVALERAHSSRNALKKKLTENSDSLDAAKEALATGREKASGLKVARNNHESLVESLGVLREWSAEFTANEQSQDLLDKQSTLKAALVNWSRIDAQVKELPVSESVISKTVDRARLIAQICDLRKDVETALSRQRDAQDQLDETEELIRASDEHLSNAQNAISDLQVHLKRVLEVQADSQCPACGRDWNTEEDLAAAIANRFESLSDLVGRPSQRLSSLISARDGFRKASSEASQISASKSAEVEKVESKLAGIEDELSSTVEHANHILETAKREDNTFDVPLIDLESIGDRYLGLPFEDIQAKYLASKAQLGITESRLDGLWNGLRHKEFNKRSDELHEHVSSAAKALTELDFGLPEDFAGGKMRELTARVLEELSQTTAELAKTESDLRERTIEVASLEEATNDIRSEVEKADIGLRDRVAESSRASRVAELAEKLASLELIKRGGAVQMADARSVMTDAISDASYLVKEGPRYAKRLQEESQVRKELDRARAAVEAEERRADAAHGLVGQFVGLSPGSSEVQALASMAGTVSEIFRRLHWPFDFKAVAFEEVDGKLEVFVEPRFAANRRIPAHQRLSAGQRAALAVSVFWTLNYSRSTVPQLMLMDEPVQNIDELNSLNFFDSLRWLVERGGRQIFLSTASRRLAALVKKKFAYLGPRFAEVELSRSGEISEIEVRQDMPRVLRAPLASAAQ